MELALLLAGAVGNPRAMDLALRGLLVGGPSVREAALRVARSAVMPDLAPLIGPMLDGDEDAVETGVRSGGLDLDNRASPLLRELISGAPEEDGEAKMLTTVEKLMYLRAVPVFGAVKLADLRPLAEDFVARRYGEGEPIFDLGEQDATSSTS